ncbi:MAG: M14 family zinc carboxypeptidase [Candidatus Nanopelagicales bacterium]
MRRRAAVVAAAVLAASLAAAVPALPASGADYPGVPTSPGPWTPTDPVGPDGFRHPTAATRIWRAESPSVVRIGTSVRGRAIVARRQGPADAPYALLVLGQMHGSEPAGRRVVERVRALRAPGSVQVWTISTMNPDGSVAGTRRNARGVDLNRNFPHRWAPTYTSRIYFPGTSAASEPETRAMMRFLDQLRPDLVVSLHQAFNSVDLGNPKTRAWAARLAAAFGLPTRTVPCRGPCAGTLTGWYNTTYAGFAVTVELPATVPDAAARRYARAALSVGGRIPTG